MTERDVLSSFPVSSVAAGPSSGQGQSAGRESNSAVTAGSSSGQRQSAGKENNSRSTDTAQGSGTQLSSTQRSSTHDSSRSGPITTQPTELAARDPRDASNYPALVEIVQDWKANRLSLQQVMLQGSNFIQKQDGLTNDDRPFLLVSFINQVEKEKLPESHSQSDEAAIMRALQTVVAGEDKQPGAGDVDDDNSELGESRKHHRDFESDEGERQGKSRKVREEDFPWFEAAQQYAEEKLTPSMRETRRILDLAWPDIAKVSRWAQQAPGAPAGESHYPSPWQVVN